MTSQHRLLVRTITWGKSPKGKPTRVQRTKWWKLTDKDTQRQFAATARVKIQQCGEDGHNFETVTRELRQLGEELLGKTSRKCKPGKETWWWNDEIEQCFKRKNEAKNTLDRDNTEENKEAYIVAKKEAK